MRAIDKVMEKQAKENSSNWTNVLIGQSRITVDACAYGVKASTLRKQANQEGFKTSMWGDEIQIYR